LEYETACRRLCDDIAYLLFDGSRPPVVRAAFAAARATRDLAAAFHRAAGHPKDQLWSDAVESIGHFLNLCDESMVANSPELRELRSFVTENADALQWRLELKPAS
jgi:hypothetical protein